MKTSRHGRTINSFDWHENIAAPPGEPWRAACIQPGWGPPRACGQGSVISRADSRGFLELAWLF